MLPEFPPPPSKMISPRNYFYHSTPLQTQLDHLFSSLVWGNLEGGLVLLPQVALQ